MKKFFTLLLALVFVGGAVSLLSACGAKGPIPESDYELKIGYTKYDPMNFINEDNQFVGFDTEFAQKACVELGYTPKFIEIVWDTKATSLKTREIDVIWNGMTITEKLQKEFLITDSYLENQQVVVVKKENAEKFKTISDLSKAKKIAFETGSAADSVLKDAEGLTSDKLLGCQAQKDAFLEVFSGSCDVAVVDITMAKSMTAEGTDYGKTLTYTDIGFEKENYGIGMRKEDTVLCERLNAVIKKFQENEFFDGLYNKYIA